YHLAAHAAVSKYNTYEKWMKNKTSEICVGVMDFIEDSIVEKYISSANPQVWKNMSEINDKLVILEDCASKVDNSYKMMVPDACSAMDRDMLNKIKSSIGQIEYGIDYESRVLEIADLLYKNRQLLPKTILPYCEHDDVKNIISPKKNIIKFELDDEFKEIAYRLDELWATEEQARIRLLRQYGKHLRGLHFDSVAVSPENLHEFAQIKAKILPMLQRIRQQIRMIVNLTDSPKTDQIGYVDMQMTIQAIASKRHSFEVFEQD
ncbi:MAG: hypothetical protein KGI27_14940, partial [Thaumarchaeota archaeon]|nr:hypothetical protein [Nitrososphaerota archaeon]